MEKCREFRLPLWLAAVDFRKAFDTVEHGSIWTALRDIGVPFIYVRCLSGIYSNQVATVTTDCTSREFKVQRGTRQGDPISPKLFNAVLEQAVKEVQPEWRRKGWGIKLGRAQSDLLCNIRFADDILL
eukprot:8430235-Karenia_brevis.AAC.1